jgi:hypothetical protein
VKVGGLDLAKRTDFSALVTLEVEAGRVTVTRALRLPQETYDRQLEAVASILADLDRLAYDAGGVGDSLHLDAISRVSFPIVSVASVERVSVIHPVAPRSSKSARARCRCSRAALGSEFDRKHPYGSRL